MSVVPRPGKRQSSVRAETRKLIENFPFWERVEHEIFREHDGHSLLTKGECKQFVRICLGIANWIINTRIEF